MNNNEHPTHTHLIVQDPDLFAAVLQEVLCSHCNKKTLTHHLKQTTGASYSIQLLCNNPQCGWRSSFHPIGAYQPNYHGVLQPEASLRLAIATHLSSISPTHMQLFTTLMDLPSLAISEDQKIANSLCESILLEIDSLLKTNLESIRNVHGRHLRIVVDVQWAKPRHHNSEQGHCIVLDRDSGNVLHFLVAQKFRQDPTQPLPDPKEIPPFKRYQERTEHQIKGYYGSSPAMEPDLLRIAAQDLKARLKFPLLLYIEGFMPLLFFDNI